MHRSGTSAFTRLLGLLGADLPSNLLLPSETNQTGYWESADLTAIHDTLLASAGSTWMDWREFNSTWFSSAAATTFKTQILDVLRRDFSDSHLFVVKDPRICRLWPLWQEILCQFGAKPLVFIPLRNPLEIAASLKWRNELIPANMYLLWLRHVLDAEFATRAETRAFATYESLLKDWQRVAEEIAAGLEISWPRRSAMVEVEVEQFLTPRLRHHHRTTENLAAKSDLVDWVKNAYRALSNIADRGDNRADRSRLDEIRTEFNKASSAFGVALTDADAELAQRTAEISEISKEFMALRGKVDELNRDRDQLGADLIQEQAETSKLRAEVKELHAVSNQRQGEFERHSADLRSAQGELRNRAEKIERLTRDLEASRVLLRDSQSENQRTAGELDSARRAFEQVRVQLAAIQGALADARRDADRQDRHVYDLEEEVRRLAQERNRLADELERKNEEVCCIEKTITDRFAALEASRSAALAESENRAEARICTLRERLVDAEAALAKYAGSRRNGAPWKRRFSLMRYRIVRQLAASGLFDANWYVSEYDDVAVSGLSPIEHYLEDGYLRGYHPNPLFDTRWYLARYDDVRRAGVNPLVHYLHYGCQEGRDPGPNFHTDYYLTANPDVRASGMNPLSHYLCYGKKEGRRAVRSC